MSQHLDPAPKETSLETLAEHITNKLDDLVMVMHKVEFTITTGTMSLPSQTFNKAGYTPIYFAYIPGNYCDNMGVNLNDARISGSDLVTGTMYVINLTSVSTSNKGYFYLSTLYKKN